MFRNLSLAGLTIFLVGGGYLLGRRAPAKPLPPVETAAPSSSAAASPPPASAPAPRAASPTLADSPPRGAHGDRIPLRDVDRELLRLYEQSQARKSAARAKAPKIKDVFPDRSYKVNLYEEDGLLARARRIAGGPGEALVQPLWSPRGELSSRFFIRSCSNGATISP